MNDANIVRQFSETITTDYKMYSFQFIPKVESGTAANHNTHFKYPNSIPVGQELYIQYIKIEQGNIATDWTPAPEDIQSQIDKSVKSTDVEYYLSNSSTSLSGGSWQTTAPQWVNGKYMWSRTKVVLNDGTEQYRPSANGVNISGAKGDTGSTGATGTGISSITEEYYLSTSKTTQTGGSWVTTPPTWENGKYIWTRSKIVYTNPSSTKWTTPIVSSEWEAVNELVVGGRNLLLNSSDLILETQPRNTGSAGDNFNYVKLALNLKKGTQYTLSFELEKLGLDYSRVSIYTQYGHADMQTINLTNSPRQYITFTAVADTNTDTTYIYAGVASGTVGRGIRLSKIKLEIGNKPTDWTPAPEDIDENIASKADKETTEKALNDATALLQTLQQEVSAAALDGELKDFIAKYNEEQKALDEDRRDSNTRLQEALNSISSITNNMDNMSETWNFVDRFIKNSPDGIVVGDNNAGSYILLKEDRLSFFSNNEEVAFIAQNLMQISRGAFVEQIQISQYIFEEYGTNQLAVRYVGK